MAPSTSSDSQAPRKSISIVRVDSDAGDDSGKERGGGTWTSLVDPSVLGTMSDVERKRQEVSERAGGPSFHFHYHYHLLLPLHCPSFLVSFRGTSDKTGPGSGFELMFRLYSNLSLPREAIIGIYNLLSRYVPLSLLISPATPTICVHQLCWDDPHSSM